MIDNNLLKISEYLKLSQKIKFSKKHVAINKIKICLIATYTIKGLSQIIETMCWQNNIDAQIYEVPYLQFRQYIFNKNSRLYKFNADLIIWLGNPEAINNEIENFISTKNKNNIFNKFQNEYFGILDQLVKYFKKNIIISLLPIVPNQILGNFSISYQSSNFNLINQANEFLISKYKNNRQVFLLDINSFILKYGWDHVHDPKIYLMSDYFISPQYLPQLSYKIMGFIKALMGKTKKCLVLDLDNTLWGGIIGEDGLNGIRLDLKPPGNAFYLFQKTILNFYRRGIILAINSNNNYQDVNEVFQKHPYMILKSKYFAAMQINWNDKVNNMKIIAQKLNIGLQSMVFIDDDPKKRIMMRQMLPEVLTPDLPLDPSRYSEYLLEINDFDQLHITKEDLERGKLYFQQAQRNKLQEKCTDLHIYLNNLNLEINIKKINSFSSSRVAQLLQRTNQFNMTTKRYSIKEVDGMMVNPKIEILTIDVKDNFGDYGICGVLIIRNVNKLKRKIDSFLLSCRVLGLQIENGIIFEIVKRSIEKIYTSIEADFEATQKNKPAEDFYSRIGFKLIDKSKTKSIWNLNLKEAKIAKPKHLKIIYDK